MHDQRIEPRPFLGGEHARHGTRVERVGAEPIDRLGRKGDNFPAGERFRGAVDGLFSGGNDGHRAISRVTAVRSS